MGIFNRMSNMAQRGAGNVLGSVGGAYLGMMASRVGKNTLIGGAAGAAYGAMSSDTSMLGGAAMGAGIGRYGGGAMKYGAKRMFSPRSPFTMKLGGRHGMMDIASGMGGMAGRQAGRDVGKLINMGRNSYNQFRPKFGQAVAKVRSSFSRKQH